MYLLLLAAGTNTSHPRLTYRENCVLVNDENTNHSEPDRFSTKSTQKHVYLNNGPHVCLQQLSHIQVTSGIVSFWLLLTD